MSLNGNQQDPDPNPKRENTDGKEFFIIQDDNSENKSQKHNTHVNEELEKPQLSTTNQGQTQSVQNANYNYPPQNPQMPGSGANIPPGQFPPNPQQPNFNQQFRYAQPAYPQYPMQPKKGKKPWTLIVVVIIGFIGLIYLFGKGFTKTESFTSTGMQEEVVGGIPSSNKIAIIDVNGIIIEGGGGGGLFGLNISSAYKMLYNGLLQAEYDDNVKAVLIYLNTPGGGVTSSDVLYHRIMEFKKNTNYQKPVIAFMKDVAASGGYYIASACDYIIAEPTTITGSIGVVMQGYNLSGLMDKLGIEDGTVTSVPDKDRGSMMRPARPYDKEFFKVLLGKMHKMFVDRVYEGRLNVMKNQGQVLTRAEVESWATGDVYLAEDALKMKLIDEIGYEEDAFKAALSKKNLEGAKFVRYYFKKSGLSLLDLAGMKKDENLPKSLMNFDYEKVIKNAGPRIWAIWLGESH